MLKAYSFIRTNIKGGQETCYLSCTDLNISNKNKTISILFEGFVSQEESQRKVKLIQNGLNISPIGSERFQLILSGDDFINEAMTPFATDGQGLPKILVLSENVWLLALNTPFISDFSTIDEDGNRVEVLKSLTDLNFTIHEVELS